MAEKTTQTPEELYNNGVDALHSERYALAVTQFDAIEQNYPYSAWAVNAQLMRGLRRVPAEPLHRRDRRARPLHRSCTRRSPDIAYAYYLRALCYYEQIADIQRDQKGTRDAMARLQEVVNRFPDSAYARDARLKIDLCRDHLAGKEMEVGRYYEQQHSMPPRSAASSAWSTITRPPTTCPRRCTG